MCKVKCFCHEQLQSWLATTASMGKNNHTWLENTPKNGYHHWTDHSRVSLQTISCPGPGWLKSAPCPLPNPRCQPSRPASAAQPATSLSSKHWNREKESAQCLSHPLLSQSALKQKNSRLSASHTHFCHSQHWNRRTVGLVHLTPTSVTVSTETEEQSA